MLSSVSSSSTMRLTLLVLLSASCYCGAAQQVQDEQGGNGNGNGSRLWSLMGGLMPNANDGDDGEGVISSTMQRVRQWADPESTRVDNATSVVPNQFIVRFNEGRDDDVWLDDAALQRRANLVAKITGGTILHLYQHTFQGVAIIVQTPKNKRLIQPGALWAPKSRSNHRLRAQKLGMLEEDRRFEMDEVRDTNGNRRLHRNLVEKMSATNTAIPVGLDRIDQEPANPLDGIYQHAYNGSGVTVFVVDSGIRLTHAEFMPAPVPLVNATSSNETNSASEQFASINTQSPAQSFSSSTLSRATCGYDFYTKNVNDPKRCADDYEHGTHVAGTIGGRRAGVAKNVKIVSVKVLDSDGGGTDAAILAGFDYILDQRKKDKASPKTPMIVNLSLGRFYSLRYNLAVRKLVKAGIVVVSAAGNTASSACLVSPASSKFSITVGSSEYDERYKSDVRSSFSNHGRCVDITAPGGEITSAGSAHDASYISLSGTSMSAPHVSGAAALYLEKNPTWTPDQVRNALINDALVGKLLPLFNKRSPNRLLYTGKI